MAPGMGACVRWCGEDTSGQATGSSTLVGLHYRADQGELLPSECWSDVLNLVAVRDHLQPSGSPILASPGAGEWFGEATGPSDTDSDPCDCLFPSRSKQPAREECQASLAGCGGVGRGELLLPFSSS